MAQDLVIYSDINKRDPLQKPRITNLESIKNSISNILNIRDKDLLFNFDNINLEDFLFEAYTEDNAYSLTNTVIDKVSKEKRVQVDYSKTQAINDPSNQTYSLTLYYDIKGLGQTSSSSFTL